MKKGGLLLSLISIVFCSITLIGCFSGCKWQGTNLMFADVQDYWYSSEVKSEYDGYTIVRETKESGVKLDSLNAKIIKNGTAYDGKVEYVVYEEGSIDYKYEIFLKSGIAYFTKYEGLKTTKNKFELDFDDLMNDDGSTESFVSDTVGSDSVIKDKTVASILRVIRTQENIVYSVNQIRQTFLEGSNKKETIKKSTKGDLVKIELNYKFENEESLNYCDYSIEYQNDIIISHTIDSKIIVDNDTLESFFEIKKCSETISFPDLTQY